MSEDELTKEEIILKQVKGVITAVIKDTATPPHLQHPLSRETIEAMRECLFLISEREQELAQEYGRDTSARPRFKDEPPESVVIPLELSGLTRRRRHDPDRD